MRAFTYLIGVVVVLIVGVGVWFWVQGDRTVEQGSEAEHSGTAGEERVSDQIRLEADAYPLYPGAEWGRETAETAGTETTAADGNGTGIVTVTSEPFVDVTNIAAVSTPFTEYYRQKLTAAGWKPDMMREADGPGANVSYYAKDDRFIIVSFQSDFKVRSDDAPSECPCDVRLSIASGRSE